MPRIIETDDKKTATFEFKKLSQELQKLINTLNENVVTGFTYSQNNEVCGGVVEGGEVIINKKSTELLKFNHGNIKS